MSKVWAFPINNKGEIIGEKKSFDKKQFERMLLVGKGLRKFPYYKEAGEVQDEGYLNDLANIPNVGKKTLKDITQLYPTYEALEGAVKHAESSGEELPLKDTVSDALIKYVNNNNK